MRKKNSKVKLPKTINFGFRIFRVILQEDYSGDDTYGHSDYQKGIICIDASMSEEMIKDTLLHEIIHIILTLICNDPKKELDNENLVVGLTSGLLLVLNLNKGLFKLYE